MTRRISLIATVLCLSTSLSLPLFAQRDIRSDTWVAVDETGRALPTAAETGASRADRVVGLFYYIWHNETAGWDIHDISKILAGTEGWGGAPSFHHYGESLFGYYSSMDEYVIRRHVQMITDAGVDFIFFDNTNGAIYQEVQQAILDTMIAMRTEGQDVPLVSWAMYNGDVNGEVELLYDTIATHPDYDGLLFRWNGKPLLLGFYTGARTEVRDHFTFRKSWAWTSQPWFTETAGRERWPWLDNYPQNPGLDTDGAVEQITVAAAQHPHGQYAIGKSTGEDVTQAPIEGTDGRYFGLQWQRALEVDPPLVMVTQWNEWIAQRFIKDDPTYDVAAVSWMAREPISSGDSIFIDVYTPEYSRDLEPLRTAYRDNMYLQLVDRVRRYKGVRDLPVVSAPMTIPMNEDCSGWESVNPVFMDDLYDTFHRDHVSFGSDLTYTNNTGRNDIDTVLEARNAHTLYFSASTREPLSPRTDARWMWLLIDGDGDAATGWNGYDFIVNHPTVSDTVTTVSRYAGTGFNWEDPQDVGWTLCDRMLQIAIPAAVLGIDPTAGFTVDFKWVDNSLSTGDILDLYVDGDAAPNGRFNYRYTAAPFAPADTDTTFDDTADTATDDTASDDGDDTSLPLPGDSDTEADDSDPDSDPSPEPSCNCGITGAAPVTSLLSLLLG